MYELEGAGVGRRWRYDVGGCGRETQLIKNSKGNENDKNKFIILNMLLNYLYVQ